MGNANWMVVLSENKTAGWSDLETSDSGQTGFCCIWFMDQWVFLWYPSMNSDPESLWRQIEHWEIISLYCLFYYYLCIQNGVVLHSCFCWLVLFHSLAPAQTCKVAAVGTSLEICPPAAPTAPRQDGIKPGKPWSFPHVFVATVCVYMRGFGSDLCYSLNSHCLAKTKIICANCFMDFYGGCWMVSGWCWMTVMADV